MNDVNSPKLAVLHYTTNDSVVQKTAFIRSFISDTLMSSLKGDDSGRRLYVVSDDLSVTVLKQVTEEFIVIFMCIVSGTFIKVVIYLVITCDPVLCTIGRRNHT